MTERAQFTPSQLAEIRDAFLTRRGITCPVCAGPMTSDSVADGSPRTRVHVVCRDCHRSATVSMPAQRPNAGH